MRLFRNHWDLYKNPNIDVRLNLWSWVFGVKFALCFVDLHFGPLAISITTRKHIMLASGGAA